MKNFARIYFPKLRKKQKISGVLFSRTGQNVKIKLTQLSASISLLIKNPTWHYTKKYKFLLLG